MFDFWLCDAQRLAFDLEWERMEREWEKKDMEKMSRKEHGERDEEKAE